MILIICDEYGVLITLERNARATLDAIYTNRCPFPRWLFNVDTIGL